MINNPGLQLVLQYIDMNNELGFSWLICNASGLKPIVTQAALWDSNPHYTAENNITHERSECARRRRALNVIEQTLSECISDPLCIGRIYRLWYLDLNFSISPPQKRNMCFEMFLSAVFVLMAFLRFVAKTDGTWHDVPNVLEQHKTKRFTHTHTHALYRRRPAALTDLMLFVVLHRWGLMVLSLHRSRCTSFTKSNCSATRTSPTLTKGPQVPTVHARHFKHGPWPSDSKFSRPELH